MSKSGDVSIHFIHLIEGIGWVELGKLQQLSLELKLFRMMTLHILLKSCTSITGHSHNQPQEVIGSYHQQFTVFAWYEALKATFFLVVASLS